MEGNGRCPIMFNSVEHTLNISLVLWLVPGLFYPAGVGLHVSDIVGMSL